MSAPAEPHAFSLPEQQAVYRAIYERRDMRHFCGGSVADEVLQRLLSAAHHAPSVGFMQPWRFIRVRNPQLRLALHALVEDERILTAQALGERGEEFMKLKVQGILDAAEILVVALPPGREKHIFGRRTLPEMDLASAACAIQNLWLAARAEGLGMGWVSIFSPEQLAQLLQMPEGSRPIAVLCLGPVTAFYDLLTPWPVIARRLDAVAAADFVVALYNPKSGRRTQQIVQAQQLFLRHRRPDTPVAVVKSAYRRRERIEFTTLAHMSECDIGMLTTVLIGNSNTFVRHGLMVTPRGYANKYELHGDGSTREGERPGRSLSTGLIGWMENLRIDHADGETVAALALRHKLPADYIDMVLAAQVEDEAVTADESGE